MQKIQYAKGKSDTIAKLDGTYRMPVAPGNEVITTELQQSIFNAPPSSVAAQIPSKAPIAAKASGVGKDITSVSEEGPQGVKRRRDDESDDEGSPMEEGDSDAPMDASSDEDSS